MTTVPYTEWVREFDRRMASAGSPYRAVHLDGVRLTGLWMQGVSPSDAVPLFTGRGIGASGSSAPHGVTPTYPAGPTPSRTDDRWQGIAKWPFILACLLGAFILPPALFGLFCLIGLLMLALRPRL